MSSKGKRYINTNVINDIEEPTQEKSLKQKKNSHLYRMLFIIIFISLIFVLITAFALGKVIANSDSDDLKLNFYSFLTENRLGFFADMIYGDNIPKLTSSLPPTKASVTDGVNVLFAGNGNGIIHKMTFASSKDQCSGFMIAVNDPTKFSIGRSTQSSNVLSEIFAVERADLAFPFSSHLSDNVLVSNSVWASPIQADTYGYFGFTKDGKLCFGEGSREEIEALSLNFATEQQVSSIICGGVPCDFESTEGDIGMPTLSVAQCADGSVLLLFLDASASVREITELLYRYSAINAAIIYCGKSTGFVDKDGSYSFDKSFESAEYTCVWKID